MRNHDVMGEVTRGQVKTIYSKYQDRGREKQGVRGASDVAAAASCIAPRGEPLISPTSNAFNATRANPQITLSAVRASKVLQGHYEVAAGTQTQSARRRCALFFLPSRPPLATAGSLICFRLFILVNLINLSHSSMPTTAPVRKDFWLFGYPIAHRRVSCGHELGAREG